MICKNKKYPFNSKFIRLRPACMGSINKHIQILTKQSADRPVKSARKIILPP